MLLHLDNFQQMQLFIHRIKITFLPAETYRTGDDLVAGQKGSGEVDMMHRGVDGLPQTSGQEMGCLTRSSLCCPSLMDSSPSSTK